MLINLCTETIEPIWSGTKSDCVVLYVARYQYPALVHGGSQVQQCRKYVLTRVYATYRSEVVIY